MLAKYKKDGSLYSTGVVAYGSTCKASGDEVMIFETYDKCIKFWNKRLEEITYSVEFQLDWNDRDVEYFD